MLIAESHFFLYHTVYTSSRPFNNSSGLKLNLLLKKPGKNATYQLQ